MHLFNIKVLSDATKHKNLGGHCGRTQLELRALDLAL
jgi:hypothetical protein